MAENNQSASSSSSSSFQPSPLSARSQEGPSWKNFKAVKKVGDKSEAVFVNRMEKATDDVNESADAFIRQFRQQLHLQRLDSIENYRQMLARGV